MSDEIVQQAEKPVEETSVRRASSRVRRFFLRHLPLGIGGCVVLLILVLVGMYFYASSDSFQNIVRERLASELSNATGGRVEIAAFRWKLLKLDAEADGVVIHGREAANEAPYAQIRHLRAQISILGFLTPSVRLSELEVQAPELHVIVYADGTTNQPNPRKKNTSSKSGVDSLFDLKVGHLVVENGHLAYDNHAANFDFQSRRAPLNLAADNVAFRLNYIAPAGTAPEKYSIDLSAKDLTLVRGAGKKREQEVHALLQGTLELTRSTATLQQFQLSERHDKTEHVLTVNGALDSFTRGQWHAAILGDLDMRLLEPALGYPFAPEGIARLNLTAKGDERDFAIDGRLHVDGGTYIGPGVDAHGITLDARVHADYGRLLIDETVVQFRKGGRMTGIVDLHNWRPPREEARLAPSPLAARRGETQTPRNPAPPVTISAADQTIPVDGKVTAQLENMPLDTVMDVVGVAPFQRLGIDAVLNGRAVATWSKGDNDTVVVSTLLALSPGRPAGEVPANGVIDATYTNKDGAVDVRKFQLSLPESALSASGRLGAYPMTSPTALTVNLHSQKLEEFDAVLRDLHLQREARAGAEALPARLKGQAEFSGNWTGSLLQPRISGTAKASEIELEIPENDGAPARFVNFDTVSVAGGYTAERITIQHAEMTHGNARVTVEGTLDPAQIAATKPKQQRPELQYNRDSVLHAKVTASNVSLDDLQMFATTKLPATGILDVSFEAHGPISAINGSGSVQLEGGTIYGQPVNSARAQGTVENSALKLSNVNASLAGGSLTGSGSYDFSARHFEVKTHGSNLEIAQLSSLQRKGPSITGKMEIDATGSGSWDDPQVQGHATVQELKVGGDPLGSLQATAHTAEHALQYDVKTTLAGAELDLHGKTDLRGDNNTDNRLEFTRFDVGALLKLAHVQGISGESSLAGTMTLAGPLKKPETLHGEAQLQELKATLSGVHLVSDGGAHATFSDGRVHLDPMHVTGEGTDVRVLGNVTVIGERRLDLAASGTINMQLAETLDPDLTASGTTTFEVEAHGTLQNPDLRGRIDVQNGAISLEDLPNGLSQLKGTLEFNQNRLEVRNLTAMTGGGQLSVGGFLAYQHGLYADLSVTGRGVRIRYPQGVSSLADATLRAQGSPQNLLVSGDVLITRFTISPDLDLAALAAQANSKVNAITLADAPSNHVRLDVHMVSSQQLNFQNAFAKLAGDIDLRLSGTLASPSVLGRISVTEGSAVIAGTRYDLQRGEITLTNPVRIEPMIDVTATAHVEDYDITLGLLGTLQKLAVSYRSDPPLPESDVVSLLALGHKQDQQRLYTQQQEQAFSNSPTDALLGGALNATMSNRVQKLFGAGSVKVDPNYLGAFGNSTSRITVQEQVGRNLTLTYATDVNTTGQQLLQADVAINRHVTLVVARDESGVFSMVVKNTRRYK